MIYLGDVIRSSGRAAEAGGLYERAIALKEPQVREDGTNTEHRFALVCSIRRRALTLLELGKPADAAANARRALALCDGLPSRPAWELFEIEVPCCHSLLAGLGGRAGSGVSAAEGEQEATKAIECLGQATANGFRNANQLRIESALDPLRNRDDFKKFISELEKNDPTQHGNK